MWFVDDVKAVGTLDRNFREKQQIKINKVTKTYIQFTRGTDS